jgi:hypothetical protein
MENKVCEDGICSVTDGEKTFAQSIKENAQTTAAVELFLFGKHECPLCKDAREVYSKLKESKEEVGFRYFDLDTVEGVSKAAYYNAFEIPVTIIFSGSTELKRWESEVPQYDPIRKDIEGAV